MLIEASVGDAYGAGFEFASRDKIKQKNTLTQYEVHPFYKSIYKKYTDDTQMALAISELLVEKHAWTSQNIADKFVEVFKRDPRQGYSKGFYKLLCTVNSGTELLNTIRPTSTRNGAAMRAYPLGVLKTETEILEKSQLQASITHNTKTAILSAQAIALMTHYFLHKKGKKADLRAYLCEYQSYKWQGQWHGEVAADAIQTVEAVLTILLQESNLSAMLKKSIDLGGDVDTVASLVLAIGCCSDEVEANLPDFLFTDLENRSYGYDYIQALDKALLNIKNRTNEIQ